MRIAFILIIAGMALTIIGTATPTGAVIGAAGGISALSFVGLVALLIGLVTLAAGTLEERTEGMSRRTFLKLGTAAAVGAALDGLFPQEAYAKPTTPVRADTRFIILHTTETTKRSTIDDIKRNRKANFVVDLSGNVYAAVEQNRLANHAGVSMWNGTSNISNHSIGIEIMGYHNKQPTKAQLDALRSLVGKLQQHYRISDDRVLTHSMVAYGRPNRWHPESHRGRKRCGMLYGTDDIRKRIGLTSKPGTDPDVNAGRLVVADKYLEETIYGEQPRVTLASAVPQRRAKRPRKEQAPRLEDLAEETAEPEDSFRVLGKDGKTVWSIAGKEYRAKTTIYFLPDGKIRRGDELSVADIKGLPDGTKILLGYTYGGHVSKARSAFEIVGKEWNYPSTMYVLPDGTLKSGYKLDDDRIPKDTLVLFQN